MSWTIINLIFIIQFALSAPTWKTEINKKKIGETTTTTIHFTKGKQRQLYIPESKSLWVLDIKEQKINSKQYFITAWSKGARNTLFRIFDPETSNAPICDVISFAEESKLRIKKGHLQIYVAPDELPSMNPKGKKPYWKNCRKLN